MNKGTNDALKGIMDAIQYMVDNAMGNLPFDRTEIGIITEVLGGNRYKVKFNDKEYTLSVYGDRVPVVNDIVKVCIPKNNLSLAYIF